jgi:hypothetical protein
MKIVFRTVCFHLLCIIVFSFLYFHNKDGFQSLANKNASYLDYFLLSTTIQAGVGISSIYPIYSYGKIIMILQQFIMILTHVFTLYVFTL